MSDGDIRTLRTLTCILHSSYFGTMLALRREKGFFSAYELAIKGIINMLEGYFSFLETKKIQEILKYLERTELYEDIKLIKEKDDLYLLIIGKCLFAGGENGVHKR